MGRAGCFVLVLVALAMGYQQWRIYQLEQQISAVVGRVQVQSGKKEVDKKSSKDSKDLVTTLAQAEMHTKNAKGFLAKKMPGKAQAEIDQALKSMKSANDVSKDIVGDVAEFMGKARDNAVRVFQKAWNDISEEAKTK